MLICVQVQLREYKKKLVSNIYRCGRVGKQYRSSSVQDSKLPESGRPLDSLHDEETRHRSLDLSKDL